MSHRRISLSASVAYDKATEPPTLEEFEELQTALRDVLKRLCPGSCVCMDLSLGVEETAFTKQSVFTITDKDNHVVDYIPPPDIACQVTHYEVSETTKTSPPEESKLTVGQSIPIHPDIQTPNVTIPPDYGQPIIAVPEHNIFGGTASDPQIQILESIARIREIGNMLDQMRPVMEAIPGIRNEINDLNTKLLQAFRTG